MPVIKRISINHLKVGMYVTDKTEGIADNKMQANGFIYRKETIDKLRAKGTTELLIDPVKGKDSPFSVPLSNKIPKKHKKTLREERKNSEKAYNEATTLITNLLNDVKVGKAIDVGPVEELANEINNSVLNNPNALLCLSQIRKKDKYLLEHSVNVGILMGIFAGHLNYSSKEIHHLVTGALLHDIGKIRVPNQILHKPGKLTDEEWQEMKRHVNYGVEILKKSKDIHPIALAICGQHHERLDSNGYPKGLSKDNITTYGRMASVVDVYDAVTAKRVYHDRIPPPEAMKLLLKLGQSELDSRLVYQFIRCMSVYPVGSLIELSNGKLGAVISTNPTDSVKPIVKTIYNKKHKHYETPKIIDLSKPASTELTIVSAVSPEDYNIQIIDFL